VAYVVQRETNPDGTTTITETIAATENLLAGLFLDHVRLEVQPQDLLR
jgi:hypothetical protein